MNNEFADSIFEEGPETLTSNFQETPEEEFPVRAPVPDPKTTAEAIRRADPIPADRLMMNIFGIMTELSKELLPNENETPSDPSSDRPPTPLPELGETGKFAKRLCILLVGFCLWFVRMLGIRGRTGMFGTLTRMIKMFEEELSGGDYDREFGSLDSWVASLDLYLLSNIIRGSTWVMNRMMDYPWIFGFLVGAFLV